MPKVSGSRQNVAWYERDTDFQFAPCDVVRSSLGCRVSGGITRGSESWERQDVGDASHSTRDVKVYEDERKQRKGEDRLLNQSRGENCNAGES